MKLVVKVADDAQVLADLNDQSFVDNPTFDSDLDKTWAHNRFGTAYFQSCVSSDERICFVALDNNTPIGYIAGSPHPIEHRLSRYFELENLGVIPGYRKKGVGKLLIEELSTQAKKLGYQKLYLSCYAKNDLALAFYHHLGFEPIDLCLEKYL